MKKEIKTVQDNKELQYSDIVKLIKNQKKILENQEFILNWIKSQSEPLKNQRLFAYLEKMDDFIEMEGSERLSMFQARKLLAPHGVKMATVERVKRLVLEGELDCVRDENNDIPNDGKFKFRKSHIIDYLAAERVKSKAYLRNNFD